MLDRFEIELRLGRLSTSSTAAARSHQSLGEVGMFSSRDRRLVTTRTVELLRSLVGSTRWRNAAQLLTLLRGLGRELHAVGGFREPAIGNVVRRVMAAVREEVMMGGEDEARNENEDSKEMDRIDELEVSVGNMSLKRRERGKTTITNMVFPQHVSLKPTRRARSDSFSSMDSDGPIPSTMSTGELPAAFYANRPDLRQSVMEAIQEIMADLEDLHKNINEQATSHIHAGEVILTYGRSKTVDLVRFMFCIFRWHDDVFFSHCRCQTSFCK